MTRIITLASGKAGVGKTAIAVNLAAQLAQRGQRVCLFDADWGVTNVNLLLGLTPQYTLRELLLGEAILEQVMVRNCYGFDIVPGSPGDRWMTALTAVQLNHLIDALRELDDYDIVLIDSASSMARHVLALLLASPEALLVITPEPHSLTDAYKLLKLLYAEHYEGSIHLVVNLIRNHTVGRHTYGKFREIVEFYLSTQLPLSGMLADDPHMTQAVQEQQPLVTRNPDSAAARDIGLLADQLLLEQHGANKPCMQTFLARYLRANAVETAQETDTREVQETPIQAGEDLQQQFNTLSDRIDQLIMENERLRSDASPRADLYMLPDTGRRRTPERCSEVCVAMNTETEEVTVQGETFSIYHMQRSNGDTQRFACHSLDDDIQKPEPKTTSS